MVTLATTSDAPELARLQQRALVVGIAGLLAAGIGAAMNLEQFYRSWLIGFLFCLGLTLGSLGLLMLQHLSGGQWGLVSRRVFEAASRTLPLVAVFFIPVLLGVSSVFEWSHTDVVANDPVLIQKAPYLEVRFFVARAVIYFAFWILCAYLLTSWSAGQDRGTTAVTEANSIRFRTVSAPGLLFLVLTITFASVDWI